MSGFSENSDSGASSGRLSDFGPIFDDCRDEGLRGRVAQAMSTDRENPINKHEMGEIATYLSVLEYMILRHHWGKAPDNVMLAELKSTTGLDIRKHISDYRKIPG